MKRRRSDRWCSESSFLFNLDREEAIIEVKEENNNIRVKVKAELIEMFWLSDDIVPLTRTEKQLEEALNGMEEVLNKYNHDNKKTG